MTAVTEGRWLCEIMPEEMLTPTENLSIATTISLTDEQT